MDGLITNDQLKKLQTIRNQYAEYRDNDAWHELIYQFTDGRESSSKKLSIKEARRLIEMLDESNRKMRNKIYAICNSLGWFQHKDIHDDKINWGVVDSFLKSRGVVKKPLRKCKPSELVRIVSQFEAIQKHEEENALKSVLKEIGFTQKRYSSY